MKKRPIVSTFYFPNWHVDPRNEMYHGRTWTEWRVTQYATPRFPGHEQPKIPLWGYGDEADPAVMETKIKAASEHGIDNFTFDFYFFEDGPYRERCLNNGFLKAANRNDLSFSIMWANHDHIYSHPGSYWKPGESVWKGTVNVETFRKCTDYCMKHYFPQPNYLRINGALHFGIYRPWNMIREMGGIQVFKQELADFRARVEQAGLGKIHLDMPASGFAEWDHIENASDILLELGADSTFEYGWGYKDVFPAYEYEKWAEKNIWNQKRFLEKLRVPCNPVVMPGWDSSPRTVQSDMFEAVGYPFSPVITESSPEKFEHALRSIAELMDSENAGPMLNLSCWNEWTEGAYLEPDTKHGYGYLEAVRNVFGRSEKSR